MLLQIIRIKNGDNWILFQILLCNGVLWPDWAWVGVGVGVGAGGLLSAVRLPAQSFCVRETKRRPPIRAGSPVACLVRKKRR